MSNFKAPRLASTILLASSLIAFPAAAEGLKMRMGNEPSFPPFVITNPDGSKSGLEIELAQEICARAKADCEWLTMEFAGLIPAMIAGKIDVIPENLLPTQERVGKILMTREVVYNPVKIVVPSSWQGGFTNEDLAGKRIGVIKGTPYVTILTDQVKTATVVTYESLDAEILDLQAGRIDGVMNGRINLDEKFFKGADADKWKLSDRDFYPPGLEGKASVWAVRMGEDKILETINSTLDEMLADCTYTKIRKKYVSFTMLKDEPDSCQ